MKSGRYGNGNTNFSKYVLAKFSPTLYSQSLTVGCGASALSLLTGKNPWLYQTKDGHYKESYMVNALRREGYRVFEVNRSNLTRSKNPQYNLSPYNLLLYSQIMSKGMASWYVSWGGYYWHNFEIFEVNAQQLLNWPIVSMYVLCKKQE